MADEKFIYDSLQDAESIAQFIASLRDGFENGRISLLTNGEEIVLAPKGLLNFSVKAKRKRDGESKIAIKISWKESRGGAVVPGTSPIRIES